jgi:phosphoribosylanthranilate isomerase
MTQSAGLRAAQLHGHESPDDVAYVAQHIRTVIKAVTAGSVDAVRASSFGTSMVLVDAPAPGSGEVFDWSLAGELPEGLNVILAGGLNPVNVASGIAQVRPFGVDVSSGVEASPGRKDPILMKRFIEAARLAAPTDYNGGEKAPYDWMHE